MQCLVELWQTINTARVILPNMWIRVQGWIQEFALGGVPSPRLHFPLEVGSPLNQLAGLWERWCTKKLSESNWWQSF